jgi:hypothetical protein
MRPPCKHNWQACWECESMNKDRSKVEPMTAFYYLNEFACRHPSQESLPEVALARYLDAINQGAYAGLSFWAAALLGRQKEAFNQYTKEKQSETGD